MGVCRVIPNQEYIAAHSLTEVNNKEEQRISVLPCNNTFYRSKKER
jgi:hypothetical protein